MPQSKTPASSQKDTEVTLESIHRLMQDAAETREKVGALRDQLKDVMEQNDEYRAVADEIKELTKKRAEAKRALQEDKDYQVISADLDDYRLKLRDIGDIMSQHLVLYYSQTQQTKIVDSGGETRSLVLTAKLGKTEA
jgi:regulator of replication initiation timing